MPPPFPSLTPALVPAPLDRLDSRTDDEIHAQLASARPVTHQKNCWAFWDRGLDALPPWCKRNLYSWVRRLGPSWDVRCVDLVPGSPNHASQYMDVDEWLPAVLRGGSMVHGQRGQHASDAVRLPLLYLHGGVYLDVGAFLLRSFDSSFWSAIEDPSCRYEVFGLDLDAHDDRFRNILNGFVAARKGNPFIQRWHAVFLELWRDRVDSLDLRYNPLIRHVGLTGPWGTEMGMVKRPHVASLHFITDYLGHNWAFARVCRLIDPSTGWNGPEYFHKHFYILSPRQEMFKSMVTVPMGMQQQLLTLPMKPGIIDETQPTTYYLDDHSLCDTQIVHPSVTDEAALQKAARDWLVDVASNSICAKFSGGYWFEGCGLPKPVAVILLEEGHTEDDITPGSWGEWLRYASTHLDQARGMTADEAEHPALVGCLKPMEIPENTARVFTGGLLEPVVDDGGWNWTPDYDIRPFLAGMIPGDEPEAAPPTIQVK